jgi:serine/threonine-protein kinase
MSDSLPVTLQLHIEEVCTRFESAWRAAGTQAPAPQIEDYLSAATDEERPTLLEQLLLLDVYYRRRRGEQPDADYAARFPEEVRWVHEALPKPLDEPGTAVRVPFASPSTAADEDESAKEASGAAGAPGYPAIPGYELLSGLGQGGMGAVIRCRDLHLDRDLAIKFLLERYKGEPHLVQRFLTEARIHGRLQHPGIVPIHELGELQDGTPYFTMKLVEGRTLADLLNERGDPMQDEARFVTVFEQVCQTMAYAHSKGAIHRDLKPANVMVGPYGEIQVMDWGLAKMLDRERERGCQGDTETARDSISRSPGLPVPLSLKTQSYETQAGAVLGTYAYMAPEQARGEVDQLDERCDVFGLGAILCEILTGRPPFAGADSEELSARAQACDHAEAFAALDGSGADAALVRLAKACLAADPAQRPRHAGPVAAAVSEHLAGVQERLRRSDLERAAAQARAEAERKRRRVAQALGAAILALLALGAGGGFWVQHLAAGRQADQARHDAEQRQVIEAALDKAAAMRDQAHWREAQALLGQARQVLGEAGPDDLRLRLDVADAELALVNRLDDIRQRLATSWAEGHFDRRTAAREYAATFRECRLGEAGDDEQAVAARIRASGVATQLVAALDEWALLTGQLESVSWLLAVARLAAPDTWGNRFRDLAVWRDRLALRALAREALQDDAAKLGELSPQLLESVGRLLGDSPEALLLLRAAQRHYPNEFWLNLELGVALRRARHYEEAAGYDRAAVALRPDVAAGHNNLGNVLADMKDDDGAKAEFRRAIDLDPSQPMPHCNLGGLLYRKGELDAAIRELHTAISLDPTLALAHNNLGPVLRMQGHLDEAIQEYRKAIEFDPTFARPHNGIGNALREKRQLDEAIQEYRAAVELDPKFAEFHYNLGLALRGKGQLEEAIGEYGTAIELDPKFAAAHFNLGNIRKDKGELDKAIQEYRAAIEIDPKDAMPHHALGNTLHAKGQLGEAIQEYRRAIELDPRYALSHGAIGEALLVLGRFREARDSTRRCLELLPPNHRLVPHVTRQLQQCAQSLALEEKLPAFLEGTVTPASANEHLALAQFCHQVKRLYAAAARSYGDAFGLNPQLAGDPRQPHRYNAACSAAMAAAGQGADARELPDKARALLRRQALAWLRADLARWAQLAARDEGPAKQALRQGLTHWQQDADLASVRDPAALDRLPDDDVRQWLALWRDVAALLVQAGAPTTGNR